MSARPPRAARRLAMLTTAAIALGGCSATARGARVEIDQARLARARALDVAAQAAVPYARYEAARRQAARSAAGSDAHASRTLEAQLWLETAIAEAEHAALSRERLADEQALIALDDALRGLERARLARARENQLRAAQALARAEVDKALARAAKKPAQRVKLSRDEARAAAEALALRAELVALAVAASAPETSGLARVRAQLRESEAVRARDPDAALALADQALYRGLALLAELRRGQDEPSDAERASLSEALTSSGFLVARDERGLAATLTPAFQRDALVAVGPRLLARLCALATAHPHGRIAARVEGARPAQARTRITLLRAELTRAGCPLSRFTLEPGPRAGDSVEVLWLSY